MNKIKIINEEILHVMKSTAKEYKVKSETDRNTEAIKRPKTPQEIFKSVIKQAVSTDMYFRRKKRLKTSESTLAMRKNESGKFDPDSQVFIIERKIDAGQNMRERPATSTSEKQRIKERNSKLHEQIDIRQLKKQIDEVLS